MPLSLTAILALINDNASGDIAAVDVRDALTALYDWIPPVEKYKMGRLPGETAHAKDDFFSSYTGYTEQAPTGTATWAATRGGLSCKFSNVGNADLAIAVKTIPAAGVPVTIETCLHMAMQAANNVGAGILFTDGTATGSNLAGFGIMTASGGATGWSTPSGTVTTATSGLSGAGTATWMLGGDVFIRLIWSAANTFEIAVSPDGEVWADFALTTFARTFTPTHMGFYVTNWNSGSEADVVSFDYLRVYEADLSV